MEKDKVGAETLNYFKPLTPDQIEKLKPILTPEEVKRIQIGRLLTDEGKKYLSALYYLAEHEYLEEIGVLLFPPI